MAINFDFSVIRKMEIPERVRGVSGIDKEADSCSELGGVFVDTAIVILAGVVLGDSRDSNQSS